MWSKISSFLSDWEPSYFLYLMVAVVVLGWFMLSGRNNKRKY